MLEQKIQKYLSNNNKSGLNSRDYGLRDDGQGAHIEYWNLTDIAEPTLDQLNLISDEEIELDQAKETRINSRKEYLSNTDWYSAKEIDEPGSYPADEKARRILARQEINQIEAATTLQQIQAFNETFE